MVCIIMVASDTPDCISCQLLFLDFLYLSFQKPVELTTHTQSRTTKLLRQRNPQSSILRQRGVEFLRVLFVLVTVLPVRIWESGADLRDRVADGQLLICEPGQLHQWATGRGGEMARGRCAGNEFGEDTFGEGIHGEC